MAATTVSAFSRIDALRSSKPTRITSLPRRRSSLMNGKLPFSSPW